MTTQGSNQHYVPRFLLRAFGHGKKSQRRVFALDKTDRSVTHLPVKDAACDTGFYDLESEDRSLEPALQTLETDAAAVIQNLRDGGSIGSLNHRDRSCLSFFIAVQMLRTPAHREDFARQCDVIRSILRKMNASDELLEGLGTDVDQRDWSIKFIASVASEVWPHLNEKIWILGRAPSACPLFIADNPVVRRNHFEAPPFRGNLGLCCPGIEIDIPLGPTQVLMMIDADLMSKVTLMNWAIGSCIVNDHPMFLHPQHVKHLNSLQVIYAERYVFSASNDFSLAFEMLDSHPELEGGPRSIVVHPEGDNYPEEEFERAKDWDPRRPQQWSRGVNQADPQPVMRWHEVVGEMLMCVSSGSR